MITTITGLPGNGKTLYALWYINALAEKEGREVYYHGIKECTLPWTEFKPEDWQKCPAGAIIVIDEAQFVFPKKPNGSKLPPHYEQLAVHRHSGYDIFLITQHPKFFDGFVRDLIGRHLHVIRKFGMQRANVWEWAAANISPEKASSHKNAVLHKFGYPKEVFGWYKSAEVHTVKRSIPAKLILACLFVVGVIAVGFYAVNRLREKGTKHADVSVAGIAPGIVSSPSASSVVGASYLNALPDAHQFEFDRTPRVAGLPQTSPRYDALTKPTSVPVPVICVSSGGGARCDCYSQQATKMNVPKLICLEIVDRGYFVDFDDNGGKSREPMASNSRSDAVVLAANDSGRVGGSVVSLLAPVGTFKPVSVRENVSSTGGQRGKALPHLPVLSP
ncbi:MAG: zonular occludens toxin [Glaciimonas sp.]|nr:zonular occludens toxin [Glaciimonas sp.]